MTTDVDSCVVFQWERALAEPAQGSASAMPDAVHNAVLNGGVLEPSADAVVAERSRRLSEAVSDGGGAGPASSAAAGLHDGGSRAAAGWVTRCVIGLGGTHLHPWPFQYQCALC